MTLRFMILTMIRMAILVDIKVKKSAFLHKKFFRRKSEIFLFGKKFLLIVFEVGAYNELKYILKGDNKNGRKNFD